MCHAWQACARELNEQLHAEKTFDQYHALYTSACEVKQELTARLPVLWARLEAVLWRAEGEEEERRLQVTKSMRRDLGASTRPVRAAMAAVLPPGSAWEAECRADALRCLSGAEAAKAEEREAQRRLASRTILAGVAVELASDFRWESPPAATRCIAPTLLAAFARAAASTHVVRLRDLGFFSRAMDGDGVAVLERMEGSTTAYDNESCLPLRVAGVDTAE